MEFRSLVSLALVFAIVIPVPAQQKQQPPAKLTLEMIMQGPRFSGYTPSSLRWSGDSQRVYFQWKRYTDPIAAPFDTYVVNRDGTNLAKLTEQELRLAPPVSCNYDDSFKRCVYTQAGDLWLYDFSTDKAKRLTATSDIEIQPRFLPGGKAIAYQRSNNLFVHSLEDGSIEQLTDIRTGRPSPEEEEPTKDPKKELTSQEFLKQEEKELLAIVKQRAALREENRARRLRENPRKPFYLQPRTIPTNLRLTGDRNFIIAVMADQPEGSKNTIVPNYITEAAYTEDLPARNNVGDVQGRSRLMVINTKTGETKPVDLPLGEKPKPVSVFNLVLSDDNNKVAFLLRSSDNKDLWRMALDPATGKARILTHDHDDAWIGGPGIFRLGFLGDNVYYQSEVTGFSHLYLQPFAAGEAKALTSGNYEVTNVELSRDKKLFYLTTSEGSPYERHLYAFDHAAGTKAKVTTAPGEHNVTLSPDENWLADIYSFTTKPDEVYIGERKSGAKLLQVTTSPSPEFLARKWTEPTLVEIPARDGKKIPGNLLKPANARKGGPAVVFVHGAGYLQNVHKWWTNYFREYMFHHILTAAGYTVLDIDYRASSGYGRDWRTGIYRFMGGKDLEDHLDAAKWLATAHSVNPKKIGIYGGSYGGFITLMALFTSPDTFAAGAALRPVTDWAHYNHGYTSNILNEPQKDPEAYRKSSPIYHAQGLKSALLICHGMVDINVHYQDSVRLAQRLIELGKDNWELASYPVEDHGFVEPASWTDEYRRIFKLFEKNLK
ncbi:MAG: S9 family peptidase [Acidobacteria bacterium]|nr:S9 family peptidase [Acidobacteriota bacterium]